MKCSPEGMIQNPLLAEALQGFTKESSQPACLSVEKAFGGGRCAAITGPGHTLAARFRLKS
ncbi:hypothetical protein RHI9324_00293 [Rhizobium sp. CECT 9324]|nr:hypothetical protein RHI9324_00293 [Rhizobium sp. CECT 9324]